MVNSLFQLVANLCLNETSYYASKQCTYTDASGRPVPAPRFKPERQDPQTSASGSDNRQYPTSQLGSSSVNQFRIYPNPPSTTSHLYQGDNLDDEHKHTRKRFRNERGDPMPVEDLIIDGPITGVSMDRPSTVELDPALTRELTNRQLLLYLPDDRFSNIALQYFSPIVILPERSYTSPHFQQH